MKLNSTNENSPVSLEYKKDYESFNFEDYASNGNPFTSRIPSDKQEEEALRSDYSGRELYEIIQNADDARATVIEIELDSENRLHVRNNGGYPFTNKGLRSVMRPHRSSKRTAARGGDTIGNKGLGIRSLLNWSDGLTIHSNGVKLDFSTSIADRKWKEILEQSPSLQPLEEDGVCPLPVFAVPVVGVDDVTESGNRGDWTTEIEILCHSSVIADVKSKIRGLHAEILLFLKNIRKISFKVDGDAGTEFVRVDGESIEVDGIGCKKIRLWEAETKVSYILYHAKVSIPLKSERRESINGEIAIGFPVDSDRRCEYLFSYFPTRIPLNLPCALHADFELKMSRDVLVSNEFNSGLMKKLARLLLFSAQSRGKLIKSVGRGNRLLPLQMLTLGETVLQTMPEFAACVDEGFDKCKVIPTIDGNYKTFRDGIYYTADVELGAFISKISSGSILNNYIDKETDIVLRKNNRTPRCVSQLHEELSELASGLTVEENALLIERLLNVHRWSVRPSVVRLDSNLMADPNATLYVLASKDVSKAVNNEGEAEHVVPPELHLNVMHPLLSKLLQARLDTDPRGLTNKLRKIANVSDADFSRVKQEIETKSSRLSIEDLNGVILWLYKRWRKYGQEKSSDAPVCYRFRLLNARGERKEVCSLLLHTDQTESQMNELHIEVIPEEDRKAFFIDYLGAAEALPVVAYYFGKDSVYITKTLGSEWIQRVEKAGQELNMAFVPCERFLRSMSLEEVLTLILSDRRFLQHIKEQREIVYSHYGEKRRYAGQSYSAYWLTHAGRVLSRIVDYVIPHTSSLDLSVLNEEIMDINRIKGFPRTEIFDLLRTLGAKDTPTDLTFAQLYHLIENQDDYSRAQRNYRELRFIIKEKMELQNQKPDENDRKILKMVWAVGPGEERRRLPKEEVYYWDNPRLPRRFLHSLWKLMMPSRTGEKSVSEIFGVRLLSDLNLRVINPDDYNKTLTDEVTGCFLLSRLKYLVAMSLVGGEYKLDTIRQKNSDIRGLLSQLRFSSAVSYQCQGRSMEAVEGDVINDRDNIYICTSVSTMSEVLESPQVCNNIAKGLCMKLKVGVENEVRFVHVIQSSASTLEYEWNELDSSLRDDIERVIGMSDIEMQFWRRLGVSIDASDVNPAMRRTKIVAVHPCIQLPEPLKELKDFSGHELYKMLFSLDKESREAVGSFRLLEDFYASQLKAEATRLSVSYRNTTFRKLELLMKNNHSAEHIRGWIKQHVKFDETVKHIAADQKIDHLIELELVLEKFNRDVKRVFPIIGQFDEETDPVIKPQYEEIMRRYRVSPAELTYDEQAIGFFDGFEGEFELLVKKKAACEDDDRQDSEPLKEESGRVTFTGTDEKSGKGHGNGGFTSSQTTDRIGRSAEKRVREYLESHPDRYESVTDVSQRHEVHCDLMYRRKDDPTFRYLEVKSVNGRKIHFTPGEIKQGKEKAELYDLALVYSDCVRIIPCAFLPGSELLKNLTPSGYEIAVEMTDDE